MNAGSEIETQKKITDPGTVMGTVGYMSPEHVRGQDVDHRSDIFSFGVILYEMLSGRRTFSGDSAIEVMSSILKEDPPELSESNTKITPALDKIVRRCLEKKPEHRFHHRGAGAFPRWPPSGFRCDDGRTEQSLAASAGFVSGATAVRHGARFRPPDSWVGVRAIIKRNRCPARSAFSAPLCGRRTAARLSSLLGMTSGSSIWRAERRKRCASCRQGPL
jgi:hypothetical protein